MPEKSFESGKEAKEFAVASSTRSRAVALAARSLDVRCADTNPETPWPMQLSEEVARQDNDRATKITPDRADTLLERAETEGQKLHENNVQAEVARAISRVPRSALNSPRKARRAVHEALARVAG